MILVTLLLGFILILSGSFLLSPGVFIIELGFLLLSLVGWRIVISVLTYGLFDFEPEEQNSTEQKEK